MARSSTSRGAPDRATRSSKYAMSDGAARMLVPEKGKVSSWTARGVATHFGGDFGFELCRFIKLLATANGVLVSVKAGPKILLEKEPSAGARCCGVFVIA